MSRQFRVKRGDDFQVIADTTTDGTAQDLTGWSIAAQLRERISDRPVHTFSPGLSPNTGEFTISAAGSVTVGWSSGLYEMDIDLTDADGRVISLPTIGVRITEDMAP